VKKNIEFKQLAGDGDEKLLAVVMAQAATGIDVGQKVGLDLDGVCFTVSKGTERLEYRLVDPTPGQAGSAVALLGGGRVGRNELCPCGSGKKFKKCHMEAA